MTDSILIVGAGVAGLHAALDCAAGGARVTVIEREPIVGGRLAATMTAANAIGKRAEGLDVPLFAAIADNDNIELLTSATLESLSGGPGNFDASIRERARFVTDACTRCKLCHTACPVVLANEFDAGLTFRKAIYTPMAETYPEPWVIDIDSCLNTPPNYLPCNRCVEVCDDDAIHFDLPLETVHQRHIGAVILAPGFKLTDSAAYAELGYGAHADIVTSAELQRLMEVPGPTGGFASKPSNEEYPESVLFVIDNLSRFALYIVASQVRQLIEQDVDKVAVLVLSQPDSDGGQEQAQQFTESSGIALEWGTMFRAEPGDGDGVKVSFENFSTRRYDSAQYDLVVLCTDVEPANGLDSLAAAAGVALADDGYLALQDDGTATAKPGVFAAGCATGPKNISESFAEASTAAAAALAQIDPRLLNPDAERQPESAQPESTPARQQDDLQQKLETLLYALIDRPTS